MFKSGYVAVIGRPNVGKSTLLNRLIGMRILAVSDKAQTTRNKINLIYSDDDSQIIFLDTPGMQTPRNELGDYMLRESSSALEDVDLITYIVDTSKIIGKQDRAILEKLKKIKDKKVILLINKIDSIPKEDILRLIEMYSKEMDFLDVIPISAREGDGTEIYLDTVKKNLPEGPKYYTDEYVTDRPMKFIVAEIIREKALRFLQEEVPHGVAVEIEKMEELEDRTNIIATIYVERDNHKGIIIGKNGTMLQKIGTQARHDLMDLLMTKVDLRIWVKVDKNWRDNETRLKGHGYL
ncbi:GTPase Era [Peptoniphilus duerdenii]|uniref:GTPase Era n=1 Tax=Peptoniphilus duerdenii ATCC BAA-1640 TaxID=862517 RepID=E0NLI7_9FIRM|nr:GTPase Era [Peptoniphilus duerdenii]EFM25377.1 ribosome biogenesis GTPase Era [Peptoniphilus duerdenii ATCC BAA-1640]